MPYSDVSYLLAMSLFDYQHNFTYKISPPYNLSLSGFENNGFVINISIKTVILYYLFIHFSPVEHMCGFSRETVIEITTNIESQEHRRRLNDDIRYPEHPRAGGTDDLETFFSLLHRYLGMIFTLRDFKHFWQKIVR